MPTLLVILGPTGSGKSSTAVEVAEQIGGEIVGCDAFQIYRGLSIGTAKPSDEERARVPHHLVDCVEPDDLYSMARYVEAADQAIADIGHRGKIPIIVGGTGLYLRALLRGVLPAPDRDQELINRMDRIEARWGTWRLHRCLAKLDPPTAKRLAQTDSQRIKRALDLALSSRRTWSHRLEREGTWQEQRERYRVLKFGLDVERSQLREELAERVDHFFSLGWIEEVKALLATGLAPDCNALKAIGYREIARALTEGWDPLAARDGIVKSTRRYVKRQRTWFRKEPNITWLDGRDPNRVRQCVEAWQRYLKTER